MSMMLTAACTNRKTFPNMEEIEPFNVIYQTAEDGMGDTIKPRLVEAGADLSRVMVIDDTEEALTLSDDRIEKAIRQNQVRLLIIDPVQAFIGADVDMNRANEVRPVFRKLGMIAEKTGCAIVLIGHLNKSSGTQSTYRGLGSIDIMAAVRSLLFIGKVKKDPTTRVLIHEKVLLHLRVRRWHLNLEMKKVSDGWELMRFLPMIFWMERKESRQKQSCNEERN